MPAAGWLNWPGHSVSALEPHSVRYRRVLRGNGWGVALAVQVHGERTDAERVGEHVEGLAQAPDRVLGGPRACRRGAG